MKTILKGQTAYDAVMNGDIPRPSIYSTKDILNPDNQLEFVTGLGCWYGLCWGCGAVAAESYLTTTDKGVWCDLCLDGSADE